MLFFAMQPYLVVFAQEITNVRAAIQDKAIVITYDLIAGNPDAECEVQLFFGNSQFQQELLSNGTGDIGVGIKGGNNKSIKINNLDAFKPFQKDLAFRVNATYTIITGFFSVPPY